MTKETFADYMKGSNIKKMTKQEINASFLTWKGYYELRNPLTRKYRVFKIAEKDFFYLGKAGAVRRGRTIKESYPVKLVVKL